MVLQIVWDNGEDWGLPGWTQEQADAAWNKLRSQRLVCREFNKIITPLAYDSIDLTKYSLRTLLTSVSAPPSEVVRRHIIAHATNLELPTEDNEQVRAAARDLVAGCKRLDTIRSVTYICSRTATVADVS